MAKIRRIGDLVSTPTTAQAQAIASFLKEKCFIEVCGFGGELCHLCEAADFILEQQKRIDDALELCRKFQLPGTHPEHAWCGRVTSKALEAE